MVSDLRAAVRKRLRMEMLRDNISDSYESKATPHAAAVMGKGLVSIAGQTYRSTTDQAVGTKLDVVNIGRPGYAIYAPKGGGGGGTVVVGGSSTSGGGGGSGGLTSDDVFDLVDTARGLSVVGGLFGIELDTNPGLQFGTGGALKLKLQTSSGLSLSSAGLSMGTPGTNSVSSTNSVSLATHTHAITALSDVGTGLATALLKSNAGDLTLANLNLKGDLIFAGGDRSILASDDLTVEPDGDLWLDPGGLIMLPNDQEMRSATIQDLPTGINGIRIWERSDATNYWQLTIGAIKADEIYVRAFVADETRINRGESYWSKSFGIVYEDFVLPAIGSDVDVKFEDSPVDIDGAIFEVGDWILMRIIDIPSGTLASKCWFQVQDGGGTNGWVAHDSTNKFQTWKLRRKKFSSTGIKVKKGNTLLDAGTVGAGWIYLDALKDGGGPFIEVGDFTAVVDNEPIFTTRMRMGNLNGTVDYSTDVYGFATGANLGSHPDDAVTPFRGMTSDSSDGVRLFNTNIHLYDAGNEVLSITTDQGIKMLQDTAVFDNEYTYIGWYDVFAGGDLMAYIASSNGNVPGNSAFLIEVETHASGNEASLTMGVGSPDSLGARMILNTLDADGFSLLTANVIRNEAEIFSANADQYGFGTSSPVGLFQIQESSATVNETGGILLEQQGSGDSALHWYLSTPNKYFTAGIDNSDGDKWKLSGGTTLGINDYIVADPVTGSVTINGLTGGSATSGMIAGVGIILAGATISVDSSVVRTDRQVATGAGLTGGGSLAADRTIQVDGTVVRTDRQVATGDGLTGGGTLAADRTIQVDSSVVRTSLTLTAGAGLTGGGTLAAPRTFDVGQGDGISVTANAVAVDSTVVRISRYLTAGNGLTGGGDLSDDRSFHVGGGNGIVANSDDVAVDLGTNSGLTFASAKLVMGTPSTLSSVTTNAVSGVNHSHAVTALSDVSAGVAALLKSTASGGLGLGSLFTTGAVDVGQSLTSGNNTIRMIYHTHDTPHTHMVINPTGGWSLDEQFGLDIDDNLLVRGWIVGKHAIQVADARMLVHFDGPAPVESNFAGIPTGHMGQVGTLVGGVIFRAGKFGKAIQTGESTTNLITNPSFETGTSGWSNISPGTINQLLEPTTGSYCGAITPASVSGGAQYDATVALSTTYTWSCRWKAPVGAFVRFRCRAGSATVVNPTTVLAGTGEWEYMQTTFTQTATSTAQHLEVFLNSGAADEILVDEMQLEQKAYATPYVDGSMGSGNTWAGTAHASTTSRSNSYVTYNDSAAFDDFDYPMTVMAWINPLSNASHQVVCSKTPTGATTGWELANSSGTLRVILRNPTVSLQVGTLTLAEWNHVAFTYDGATVRLYLNGVETGSIAATQSIANTNAFWVGARPTNSYFNGWIDELALIDRAMTADEVRAIYESNAPVFAETATFQWRAGRNRIYADSEGLWGLGASGAAILGLYAGDDNDPAATKSWGGVSLSEGDFLLGRYGASNGGWLLFDQDLVGGNPALSWGYADQEVIRLDSGGASLFGVLDISTTGGIYQGTGTFGSPTTGLKIWNSGGIGRIGGYNSGTLQWYGNTDGKLYAGAGAVQLDANGIAINVPTIYDPDVAYRFLRSGVLIGNIASYSATNDAVMLVQVNPNDTGTRSGVLEMSARGTGSFSGSVRLKSYDAGIESATLTIGGVTEAGSLFNESVWIKQDSTVGAQPTLRLLQDDDSEEFIQFDATVSGLADAPISTAAAGSYYGKVRVSVNGTFKWIHLYN